MGDVSLARFAHLDECILQEIASIGIVVGLDAEDAEVMSGEAIKCFQSDGEVRKVELNEQLIMIFLNQISSSAIQCHNKKGNASEKHSREISVSVSTRSMCFTV